MSSYDPMRLAQVWGLAPVHLAPNQPGRVGAAVWQGRDNEIWSAAAPDTTVLGLALHPYEVEVVKDGRCVHAGAWPAGGMQLMPAGVEPRAVFRGAWRLLHVYLPVSLLAEAGGDARAFRDPLGESDDQLRRLLAALLGEIREVGGPDPLAVDGLGLALASRLVRRWGRHGGDKAQSTTGCDWRLQRSIEYLEAALPRSVGLVELAALVGLSTVHLTALFRNGTGEPPHRWLMRRRVERACEMLADPMCSITEVAHACGFASSQHLATAFRKRLGMTPSQFRRQRLS